MADQIASGDTKEAVAFALLMGIAQSQGKTTYIGSAQSAVAVLDADEDWVLDTYARCLRVAGGSTPQHARKVVAEG